MHALGAEVFDTELGVWSAVKTQEQARHFFRTIAFEHGLRPIPRECADHEWLCWLIKGHYAYCELCPAGVDYFVVRRNSDIGHKGDALAFTVVSQGARGFERPFSVGQALLGVPKDESEKVRLAFRRATEEDNIEWSKWNRKPLLCCGVFNTPIDTGKEIVTQSARFSDLIDAFCRKVGKSIDQFLLADNDLVEPDHTSWRSFYDKNAQRFFVSVEGLLELDRCYRLVDTYGLRNLRS
jgi:hypothetical protein